MPTDFEDIQGALNNFEKGLEQMARRVLERAGARITQAATEDHMQDAGIDAGPRQSAQGPLRIVSGRLARSLMGGAPGPQGIQNAQPNSVGAIEPGGLGTRNFRSPGRGSTRFQDESIHEVNIRDGTVRLRKGSKVPYAGVHEFGWAGVQRVRRHTRTTPSGTTWVEAHQRSLSIPARPFLRPALRDNRERLADIGEEELGRAVEVVGLSST